MFRAEPRAAGRPAVDYERRMRPRDRTLAAAVLSVCAAVVLLWPYTSVVVAGPWSILSVTVIVVIVATGMVVRLIRGGRFADGALPFLAQLVVGTGALTLLLVPQGALLGIIPTGTTASAFGRLAVQALDEVRFGTAPLADTPGLRTMLAVGFALAAILLDQLISARYALPAIILITAIGAIPMIVALGDANVPWFVMLAVISLFLLRHSVRHDGRRPRRASVGLAVTTGAAAIAAALVVTPVLPISSTWVGVGTSTQLDPSLRLGEDLRRPTPFTVMTLATSAASAPYLRIATLSEFDGSTWSSDDGDVQAVTDGFGDPDWTEQIETVQSRTSIRVTGISGSWLPVPYAATKIVGVASGWQIMPDNRTVTSAIRDAADEDYTVTSEVVAPTLEQIQAAGATPADIEVPAFIADTASEVTAGATNDYDRLIAMQSWFRSEFTYSLDAPVDGDFDGTGTDAVEEFLQVRSGYCIHFSGAFALMAEALDMQVRIVVGYLPGSMTDEKRGDETIYAVSSDQLHAWPEVHFAGIGWVPFEPTASLGNPTGFLPANTGGGSVSDPTLPEPSATPSSEPSTAPRAEQDPGASQTPGGDSLQRVDPGPVVLVGAGILFLLLVPMLVRLGVGAARSGRARHGDAAAAWQEVRATLVDLGVSVSDADTPRMRGATLVERGADPAAVDVLVDAVERSSYARVATATGDLSRTVRRVTAQLRRSVDTRDRVTARLLPRSLVVRRDR
ncbi:transglutaminase family protein [Microbacterium tenebrionis]|uniref:transglutaminase family protein n=1 Tax=Microbacterium tenebrionis TaxID=2830665 RepID=UPI00158E3322|nr:DUF3488 and transglutaminase-like domain-containing protein [Microbacterium ihumii]